MFSGCPTCILSPPLPPGAPPLLLPLLLFPLIFQPLLAAAASSRATTSNAATTATTLQADIVFPRPEGQYTPTTPFPFVFLLHNFDQAWAQSALFSWSLSALVQPTGHGTNLSALTLSAASQGVEAQARAKRETRMGSELLSSSVDSRAVSNGISEPHFLLIGQSEGLGHDVILTRTIFLLDWEIHIDQCPSEREDPTAANEKPVAAGTILFFVDPEDGQVPNVLAQGQCPTILASLTLDDVKIDGTDTEWCTEIESSYGGEKCASEITADTARQVEDAMLAAAGCQEGGTWPKEGKAVCDEEDGPGEGTVDGESVDGENGGGDDDGTGVEHASGSGTTVRFSFVEFLLPFILTVLLS